MKDLRMQEFGNKKTDIKMHEYERRKSEFYIASFIDSLLFKPVKGPSPNFTSNNIMRI